jgi:hypothetical protein
MPQNSKENSIRDREDFLQIFAGFTFFGNKDQPFHFDVDTDQPSSSFFL